jgi:NADPH:quinone reductase-like Zn-dependent oxidoreductase
VQGAAGAVGQALLALGRSAGLELGGTAHGEHAALVRKLGATPIDYQREDFTRVLPGGLYGFGVTICTLIGASTARARMYTPTAFIVAAIMM